MVLDKLVSFIFTTYMAVFRIVETYNVIFRYDHSCTKFYFNDCFNDYFKFRLLPLVFFREIFFLVFANNKGADQPAYLCSLNSVFVNRLLERIISRFATSEILTIQVVAVAVKTDLSRVLSGDRLQEFCNR